MAKNLFDVVDSKDPIVREAVSVAIRTVDGCWIYNSWLNDDWGRPWMHTGPDEATRVDVALFEWYHDAKIPTGYDVESACSHAGCCNPLCLILWEIDNNDA